MPGHALLLDRDDHHPSPVALTTSHVPVPQAAFGLVRCEPGWAWSPSFSDFDVWLVLSGAGTLFLGDETLGLGPGSCLVMRPGDRCDVVQDPRNRLTVAYSHFVFRTAEGAPSVPLEARLLPPRLSALPGHSAVEHDMGALVETRRRRDPLAELHARTLLLSTLLGVYAAVGTAGAPDLDGRVARVVARLRREPGVRLTLERAAADVGLSAVHLSRLFRRSMGTSFREFSLEVRLERGRELLMDGRPVANVARLLGYTDVNLFSRQMSSHFGRPPSSFRDSPVPYPLPAATPAAGAEPPVPRASPPVARRGRRAGSGS